MLRIFTILVFTAVWLTLSPVWADQCLKGNCIEGYGKKAYASGYTYEGQFSEGRRNGFAMLTDLDGSRAIGFWVDDEITEGVLYLPDGGHYLGHWKHRERNGDGILVYPDGTRYVGEFKSGRRHGWGMTIYADGRKYAGEFDKGQRSGWGTLTYPDGRRYVGQFQNGSRTGQGTMIYPDGRSISGRFLDGEYQQPK